MFSPQHSSTPIDYPKQRKYGWLLGIGALCLVLPLCVLFSWSFLYTFLPGVFDLTPPNMTLDHFCNALRAGNFQEASTLLISESQRAVSEEELTQKLPAGKVLSCTYTIISYDPGYMDGFTRANVYIMTATGRKTYEFILTDDGDFPYRWRICTDWIKEKAHNKDKESSLTLSHPASANAMILSGGGC